MIGVPAQWNIMIAQPTQLSVPARSPGGRKSGEVDCGPAEQAEYCVGRGAGGLHLNGEKTKKTHFKRGQILFMSLIT